VIKDSSIFKILVVCIALFHVSDAYSAEYLLESGINLRTVYDDNIFLTDIAHDSVKGIIITPTLSGVIKEKNWESQLSAKIRSHTYSDDTLDTNDQFFDLTGRYNAERNIFSLNYNYAFDSNLNSTSTDFGIAGRRVNRKVQSLTPQYTRLLTERSAVSASYSYADVDYLEAEATGYTPYVSESGSLSLIYNLTENDEVTIGFQIVDYTSKNDLITYQLYTSRVGIDHKFSEILSADFMVGASRQNTTNLSTQTFDFFGNTIVQTQEIDYENRGFVLDAGIRQQLESGVFTGRISRNNVTNSFGGLDRVDQLKINFSEKLSSTWSYTLAGRFEDITSISSGTRTTDRDALFFESIINYSITEKWKANASYRYIQRKFKSDTTNDRAPHSNRIYLGLTYNFPTLSTF